MRRKIPKTELLITFEVVARYESYTRAAEELALTPGAVFRQIAKLEAFLHTSLFNRCKRKISLNMAGKYCQDIVNNTLNTLERNTTDIMTWQPAVQIIELAVPPTLATHWLIPALAEFNRLTPQISINVHALTGLDDIYQQEFDVVIMREDFCSPYSEVEYLFEENAFPICSKKLLSERGETYNAITLLNRLPLLHQSTRINAWQEWFALSNITSPKTSHGPYFNLISMLIAAVRSHQGVALLPLFAIQHDLDNGNMVIPYHVPFRTGNRFIMTGRKEKMALPHLTTFRDWLIKKSMSYRTKF